MSADTGRFKWSPRGLPAGLRSVRGPRHHRGYCSPNGDRRGGFASRRGPDPSAPPPEVSHELEAPPVRLASPPHRPPAPKRPKVHPEITRLETRWLLAASITNGIVEYATTSAGSAPIGAVAGADGNLWVAESAADELVAFMPNGVVAKTIPVAGSPYAVTSDANGNLWATLDGPTPALVEYSTGGDQRASYLLTAGADPQGITVGPGNSIWFAQYGADDIAGLVSGKLVYYTVGKATRPEDVAVGSDGNLWVTNSATNQIARIGTNGLGLTTFTLPTKLATPWAITAGPDGNLWFTESTAGQIGRITTGGVITEFALGSSTAAPKGIVTGPDGNLWFTESGANLLGRLSPYVAGSLAHLVQAADPQLDADGRHRRPGRQDLADRVLGRAGRHIPLDPQSPDDPDQSAEHPVQRLRHQHDRVARWQLAGCRSPWTPPRLATAGRTPAAS